MGAWGIVWMALLVSGCGRVSFDAAGDAAGEEPSRDSRGGDGPPDVPRATPSVRPVQSGGNVVSGAVAVALTTQITSDLMVVVININSATEHVLTVTDTSGSTFVSANLSSTSTENPGGNVVTEIWYAPVETATVPNRITVTTSNNTSMWDVTVVQISQIDLADPIDVGSVQGEVPGTSTLALTEPLSVKKNSAIVVGNSCSNLAGLTAGSVFTTFVTSRNDDVAYLVGAHDEGAYEADWKCATTCGEYNVSAVALHARPL